MNRHSDRSSYCLHSVTALLDKSQMHTGKLWAISLSGTLWTLLSMVWQRSSAWWAQHISCTASFQQDLFYDFVNKARVRHPKSKVKGAGEQTEKCTSAHVDVCSLSVHMSMQNHYEFHFYPYKQHLLVPAFSVFFPILLFVWLLDINAKHYATIEVDDIDILNTNRV